MRGETEEERGRREEWLEEREDRRGERGEGEEGRGETERRNMQLRTFGAIRLSLQARGLHGGTYCSHFISSPGAFC